jgi:hypothetical protein
LSTEGDQAAIRAQAEKILGSGMLGRSRFYTSLLEYLLACAERGHVPKEIEIAAEVFQRGEDFDPSQDSMVRVYAHNLRQKLQQYYADQGRDESEQITIPKGEYRIVLASAAPPEAPIEAVEAVPARQAGYRFAAAILLSAMAGLLFGTYALREGGDQVSAYREVALSPLWASVTDDALPITIVVGDYYIFGELDRYGNVVRMVREFDINSRRDLDDRFMLDPEFADRYLDLDLSYLPTSTAFAMRSLMRVLAATDKEIRVVASSKLDTAVLREGHIVYVGYLSGMGMLSDFVFGDSVLAIGETYDEIVDGSTGTRYVSEAGLPTASGSYRDYGLFATRPGPAGNQLVFVTGTRDEGLMQTAETVSEPGLIDESVAAVSADGEVPPGFDLLYAVAGLDRTNLSARIVYAGVPGRAAP